MAALILWPLLVSNQMVQSAGGDLAVHVSGIVEARTALAEGQFPLRIAPIANDGTRYPFFAYYGNLPYTAAGLLCHVLRVNPYTAWKIVNVLALSLGGLFAFRCCEVVTRRTLPAIVGGVVFVLAPYMWTDVHVRFAFPETVAFNLLPVVLFYAIRCFTTRRLLPVLLGGIAWNLLALSHNIAYLYSSLFFGLFFALLFTLLLIKYRRTPRLALWRAMRVGAGYGLGLVLTLWFLVPQLRTLDYLDIADQAATPVGGDVLTTPAVLFSPVLTVAPGANTPNMGLQIGWPLLAGVLLAATALRRRKLSRWNRAVILAALPLFVLALFLVAMPSAWWRSVPKLFHHVQSSYRLLMFVVLWGALLTAIGVQSWMHTMRRRHLFAALALIAIACLPYLPRPLRLTSAELQRLVRSPDLGGNGGKTNYRPSRRASAQTSFVNPDVNFAAPEYALLKSGWIMRGEGGAPSDTYLPRAAVQLGGHILIEGAVPREYGEAPAKLSIGLDDVPLPEVILKSAENFHVAVPLQLPADWSSRKGPVRLSLRADRYPFESGRLAFPVYRLAFRTTELPTRKFHPVEIAAPLARSDARTRIVMEVDEPSLFQAPVLYYPDVLRVRVDGKEIHFGNVGPYVAVPLEPGRRRITIEYIGVRWANFASGAAWLGVLACLVAIVGNSAWRKHRRREAVAPASAEPLPAPRARRTPAFSAGVAFASFAVVGGILFAPAAWRQARQHLRHGPNLVATASHFSDEAHPPGNAFDGNDATEWSAWGGEPVVTLTVAADRPASLRKVTLESRQTGLNESWQAVRIEQFLNETRVMARDVAMPQAATNAVVEIPLEPVMADRIEFHFSSPVCVTRDGGTRVDPAVTSPGYREIRLDWTR